MRAIVVAALFKLVLIGIMVVVGVTLVMFFLDVLRCEGLIKFCQDERARFCIKWYEANWLTEPEWKSLQSCDLSTRQEVECPKPGMEECKGMLE